MNIFELQAPIKSIKMLIPEPNNDCHSRDEENMPMSRAADGCSVVAVVHLDGFEEVRCSLDDDHQVGHVLLQLLHHGRVLGAHLPHPHLPPRSIKPFKYFYRLT